MAGYTKLFSDIVDSSIWQEPPSTCKVWITLLALCDADGYVRGSEGWLALKSRLSIADTVSALNVLLAPDPSSRTPDNDGRRVEKLEDGWLILNYLIYRERLSNDAKAKASRERVRRHREQIALRNANSVTTHASASASDVLALEGGMGRKPFRKPTLPEAKLQAAKCGLPEGEAEKFINYYESKGWSVGKSPMKNWVSAMSNWKRNYDEGRYSNGNRQHQEKQRGNSNF